MGSGATTPKKQVHGKAKRSVQTPVLLNQVYHRLYPMALSHPPAPTHTCVGVWVQADVKARVGGEVVAVGGHEGHQVDAARGDAILAEQVEEVCLRGGGEEGSRGEWQRAGSGATSMHGD